MCLLPVVLWGCKFDKSGVPLDDAAVDAPVVITDAPPADALPPACTANETYCDGNVLMTCNQDGSGPVDAGRACEFICGTQGTAQCLYASDIPDNVYDRCENPMNSLTLSAGYTSTIKKPASDMIQIVTCDAACSGAPELTPGFIQDGIAYFCLSSVGIAKDASLGYAGEIAEAIVWIVDGPVDIAGTIDFSGHAGFTIGDYERIGGPGGHAGAALSNGDGNDGRGDETCRGRGGKRMGESLDRAAGGGGGGGYAGIGGTGGTGIQTVTAAGGAGGDVCGSPELIPLTGGSGGGGGADGNCLGSDCGWPGGGGGGALQIASRKSIAISGEFRANGGNGFGPNNATRGGGGGGGAGGGLLLEAPIVTVSGILNVDGGDGGRGDVGEGGIGASGDEIDGANGVEDPALDPDAGVSTGSGSGGGGGGGRIRLNTPDNTAVCGAFASPVDSCTSGALSPTQVP